MAFLGFLNIIFIRIPILFLYYKLFNIKDTIAHKFYVILLFLSLSFYNFLLLVPPPVKHTHTDTREKSCFSNQRVIMGAIEMYNMDNKQMMTSIDFSRLLEGKYLKEIPPKPTTECDYFSTKYKINMANQKSIKVSVHNKTKYNKRTDCNNIKF